MIRLLHRVLSYFLSLVEERLGELPAYDHDCEKCVFLGHHTRHREAVHDLYFCEKGPTVVARYGDEGPSYISGISFAAQDHFIAEAVRRAKERGLLSAEKAVN